MRSVAVLAFLAGCGVAIDGQVSQAIDASAPRVDAVSGSEAGIDAGAGLDAAPDATSEPLDARVCSGGDAHVVAPDGSCLILLAAAQTWVEAQASCGALGAHPAVLASAAMDTAGETLAGNHDAFIGLTDEATEGTFVWVDGAALAFANWHTGEPNNGGGRYAENCAVIAGARAGKQWDDRPCAPVTGVGAGKYSVICQQ
jgi:hypothetical protein